MSAALTPLVVVGAGGFARETAQLLRDHPRCGRAGEGYELVGFLDDDPVLHGRDVAGTPVLGPTAEAVERSVRGQAVLVCVGNPRAPRSRYDLVARLGLADEACATVVHPLASVSGDSVVGAGSVLLAGAVLTAGVRLGRHAVVMPQVVLTHEDEVGDAVTFGAGVRLAGGVQVGDSAYLGSGSMVREGRRIGAAAVVGMGSVVLSDVPPAEVWAGVPARRLSGATPVHLPEEQQ